MMFSGRMQCNLRKSSSGSVSGSTESITASAMRKSSTDGIHVVKMVRGTGTFVAKQYM